jgi:hypothetical protein
LFLHWTLCAACPAAGERARQAVAVCVFGPTFAELRAAGHISGANTPNGDLVCGGRFSFENFFKTILVKIFIPFSLALARSIWPIVMRVYTRFERHSIVRVCQWCPQKCLV